MQSSGHHARGLAKLPPAFKPERGTVTAGNSSQFSDGASVTLLMSAEKAKALGVKPIGVFRGFRLPRCEPDEMGIGPVFAVPKLLKRTGMKLADIDVIELNEAFASQVVYCRDKLGLDPEKLNSERRLDLDRPPVRNDRIAMHGHDPSGAPPHEEALRHRHDVRRRGHGRRRPLRGRLSRRYFSSSSRIEYIFCLASLT